MRPWSWLLAAIQRPSRLNAIERANPGTASMCAGARGSCVDHSTSRSSLSLDDAIQWPSALTAMAITNGPTGARSTSGSALGSGRRHSRAGSLCPQLSKWPRSASGEKRSAAIDKSCPRSGVGCSPGLRQVPQVQATVGCRAGQRAPVAAESDRRHRPAMTRENDWPGWLACVARQTPQAYVVRTTAAEREPPAVGADFERRDPAAAACVGPDHARRRVGLGQIPQFGDITVRRRQPRLVRREGDGQQRWFGQITPVDERFRSALPRPAQTGPIAAPVRRKPCRRRCRWWPTSGPSG